MSPNCDYQNECKCPEGYELSEDQFVCTYVGAYDPLTKNEDLIPCDVDAQCHINAKCSWYEQELRHICICNHGFSGDGYNCDLEEEDSCAIVSTKSSISVRHNLIHSFSVPSFRNRKSVMYTLPATTTSN